MRQNKVSRKLAFELWDLRVALLEGQLRSSTSASRRCYRQAVGLGRTHELANARDRTRVRLRSETAADRTDQNLVETRLGVAGSVRTGLRSLGR